jgi:hypothetical protein
MKEPKPAKRKTGKRWDKTYQQLTAYVRKETHMAVRLALLPTGQEISELVEDLLTAWLAAHSAPTTSAAEQRRATALQQAIFAAEREFTSNPEITPEERIPLMASLLGELAKKLAGSLDAMVPAITADNPSKG